MNWPHWCAAWKAEKKPSGGRWKYCGKKQEEFTAITENMREGIIVVDSKGDVMSYNKSALKLLEFRRSRQMDMTIRPELPGTQAQDSGQAARMHKPAQLAQKWKPSQDTRRTSIS